MGYKTERIELKTESIMCTPVEAYSLFHTNKEKGLDVAWYTTLPCLSLVMAQVAGNMIV